MSQLKFIHAADLHLDSPLERLERYEGAPVDTIRLAARRALARLVDLALAEQVAFVVIAGDLYDGDWRHFETGLFFVSQMVRLREAGIPVIAIAGNHDAMNKMTRRLPLPDNVRLLGADQPETVILDACDVAIHGQSFARPAVLENLAGGYPRAKSGLFNLGLLHTAATGREGHEPYAPCSLDDLRAKGYDYWALGHIHQREVLCDDPPIVFAGNIQGRHVREAGPKGCILARVNNRQTVQVEPVWLDVLRWEHCRILADGAATAHDLLDRLRQRLSTLADAAAGRALAVRVEIAGTSPAHRDLAAEPLRWTNDIRALAQEAGHGELWIEKVLLHTQLPRDAALALDGPVGELVQWIAELKADPTQLAALGGELSDLLDKLPPELQEGPAALGLDRPERLRESLDDVEQRLVHHLLGRSAGP